MIRPNLTEADLKEALEPTYKEDETLIKLCSEKAQTIFNQIGPDEKQEFYERQNIGFDGEIENLLLVDDWKLSR